jgi:hypothetical protein
MRTKALLSVAAIAASAISAMAQGNVYSLNIVGYATVSVAPGYNLLANPLTAGVTNGANEIMPIIDGETILTWNGKGFDQVNYDSGATPVPGWVTAAGAPSQPPSLPPGKGFFFFNPNTAASNFTFVGQVVPNPGGTNNANHLPLAPGYSLIGSPLPASVALITNTPVSLPVIDGMSILQWNGKAYVTTIYDSGAPTPPWVQGNGTTPTNAPPYNIGGGFFFFNPNSTAGTWTQSLP